MTWFWLGRGGVRFLAVAATSFSAVPASAADAGAAFSLSAAYTSDSFANLSGGKQRGVRYIGLFEASAESDLTHLGLDGAAAFVRVQHAHGRSLSDDLVGDAQIVSNIDAPDGLRLFEAWLSLPIAEDTKIWAGLIDLNGIFDVQEVGARFGSSSHGIGPDFSQSGLNGPSIFPTTSAAVVATWQGPTAALRVGAFDAVAGDPDHPSRTVVRFPGDTGLLIVGEGEVMIAKDAQVQFGAWTYTSRFVPIGGEALAELPGKVSSSGAYALAEARVGTLARLAVHAWVRVGVADEDANPIGLYVGGGMRVGDEGGLWGVGIAHARLGQPARAAGDVPLDRAETAIEFTYARQVGDHVTLQPTLHYVFNPGWEPAIRNALVAGLRVRFEL